jgi:hypothetical protein
MEMFNVNRRAIASLIALVFLFTEWTFFDGHHVGRPSLQNHSTLQPALSNQQSQQPQQLYHLIDNYSKDQLPLPLANQDDEPPAFKRILFWNTVSLIR